MNLTEHFTLEECEHSDTAKKLGLDNTLPSIYYNNAMNIYLKGVYNRMNDIKVTESAEELKRKLELVKDKIAKARSGEYVDV